MKQFIKTTINTLCIGDIIFIGVPVIIISIKYIDDEAIVKVKNKLGNELDYYFSVYEEIYKLVEITSDEIEILKGII